MPAGQAGDITVPGPNLSKAFIDGKRLCRQEPNPHYSRVSEFLIVEAFRSVGDGMGEGGSAADAGSRRAALGGEGAEADRRVEQRHLRREERGEGRGRAG